MPADGVMNMTALSTKQKKIIVVIIINNSCYFSHLLYKYSKTNQHFVNLWNL